MRLNPEVDPELIDWEAAVDPKLRIPENREKLAKAYPMYRWYKKPEKKHELEDFETDLNFLYYVIDTAVAPEDREAALRILEELEKRAAKAEELKKKLGELSKRVAKVEEVKPAWEKMGIHELYKLAIEEIRRRKGR